MNLALFIPSCKNTIILSLPRLIPEIKMMTDGLSLPKDNQNIPILFKRLHHHTLQVSHCTPARNVPSTKGRYQHTAK